MSTGRPGRDAKRALVGGVALLAAGLCVGAPTRAQDFFRVAPGKLSTAHEEWDKSDGCGKCHELGGGVKNLKCLGCHTHEPLQKAIERGDGLHAGFKEPCIKCHTEHKGADANINSWEAVGGRQNFDHARTQFALQGKHTEVACTACHRKRLKSGRQSYPGLQRECLFCHKETHRFGNDELAHNCKLCHAEIRADKAMTARTTKLEHAKFSKVPLEGKHANARCAECHKQAKFSHPDQQRSCADCHKSPHGKNFVQKACTECHHPARPFKQNPAADHDKTKFPLRGGHVHVACGKCHTSPKFKPAMTCLTCHQDPHQKRFDKRACESCHKRPGEKEVAFDHDKETKFLIRGKHKENACRKCHVGKRPDEFEKQSTTLCMDCHRHEKAHQGEYKQGRACKECHAEGGVRERPFNHLDAQDTRFVLTGLHAKLVDAPGCLKCHPGKRYRIDKLACADCHRDVHQGQLGRDCQKCHATERSFKQTPFDHTKQSRWPLVGKHQKAKCEGCHKAIASTSAPTGPALAEAAAGPSPAVTTVVQYKLGQKRCFDCHGAKEPHGGTLGKGCERCHLPDKGAPLFQHDTMARFALRGAHLKVACAFCHTPKTAGPAPAVGWTKGLVPAPFNKRVVTRGATCADCHRDQHDGRYGARCESCHGEVSFKEANRAVHDTGAFRLDGVHDDILCGRCHAREVTLAGMGDQCQICHREDDVHRGGLGAQCGQCHGQQVWAPARFDHAQTGTLLRGGHRLARCQDCHPGGSFQATPSDCAACHQGQAGRVQSPLHTAELSDCERCHNEVSFRGARYVHASWPLRGAHATVTCADCHSAGQYSALPAECEDCHAPLFDAAGNSPNHRNAGFAMRCGDCHTPVAWQIARYQHQSFTPHGRHVALGCLDCHPGESYQGAFGGLPWDCSACHGPAGPVNRWPPDHAARGYPTTCEQCHTETAFRPAIQPR